MRDPITPVWILEHARTCLHSSIRCGETPEGIPKQPDYICHLMHGKPCILPLEEICTKREPFPTRHDT